MTESRRGINRQGEEKGKGERKGEKGKGIYRQREEKGKRGKELKRLE